ncbi:TonB-dependent receptor (plasmid) [Novosphingobium sp. PP1Y]|nr:TonB-dependent receptor [Novosphingobium sp. PP1Y]
MDINRRILSSGVAILAIVASSPILAQTKSMNTSIGTNKQLNDGSDDEQANPQDIIVTGTSIRGVGSVGSPVISLGRETLSEAVRSSPVDILRQLPAVSNLGFDDTPRTTNNGNVQRGRTINLRGIGAGATLLLIDGNRIAPTGNVVSFVDADQLPTAALERIEVVAEGASAIYGSDAVAGVVNYIPRRNFKGIEVSGRTSFTDGYSEWGGSLVAGHNWGSGSIVVAYDYNKRTEMREGESRFLRQDLTPFGGLDGRVDGNSASLGVPGSIVVARTTSQGNNPTYPTAGLFNYYTPVVGRDGRLTYAELTLNRANLVDASDYNTYLPANERHQVSVSLRQEVTSWLTASVLAFYNWKHSQLNIFPSANVNFTPGSAFYVSGIPGVSATANERVVFSFAKDIGTTLRNQYNKQWQVIGNLKANLPAGWIGQLNFNDSRNINCALCVDANSGNVDRTALQAAVTAGTYNPLSPTPASAAVLSTFMPAAYDRNRSNLREYALRFDGPLLTLPGGQMKAAVGATYMEIDQFRTAMGQGSRDVAGVYAKRNVRAAYGELSVPLIGEDFTLPAVKSLLVNIALRTERYSDFGTTTNPKVGVNWDVVEGLRLRGSWSRSFRAPNLIEIGPQFFTNITVANQANAAGDPTIPINVGNNQTTVVRVTGGNASLSPEKAKTLTFGFDFKPVDLPGLNISSTYYDISYSGQIITLQGPSTQFLSNATNRQIYADYIVAASQPSNCLPSDQSTWAQIYRDTFAIPTSSGGNIDVSNICNAKAVIYGRNTNASSVRQRGIDVQASYGWEAAGSEWRIDISGTKIISNKLQVVPGGAVLDALDVMNQPVSFRGIAGFSWSKGPIMLRPSLNVVGSYRNDLPITINGVVQPINRVPSWTTVDLVGVLKIGEMLDLVNKVDLTVNVRNLLDRDPPVVISTNSGYAFDNQNANPFGRIVSLQLTTKF